MTIVEKVFYWAPRLLSIGFLVFISAFALDTFNEYQGWAVFPALLLPTFALTIALVFAWKYDLLGTILFLGFAVWYVWLVGLGHHWSWYTAISGPAVLVALLFLISWYLKRRRLKLTNK